jgi:hypothetical protein
VQQLPLAQTPWRAACQIHCLVVENGVRDWIQRLLVFNYLAAASSKCTDTEYLVFGDGGVPGSRPAGCRAGAPGPRGCVAAWFAGKSEDAATYTGTPGQGMPRGAERTTWLGGRPTAAISHAVPPPGNKAGQRQDPPGIGKPE